MRTSRILFVRPIRNPTAVGTQTISYQVTDRAGPLSSAVRTVHVGVNAGKGGGGGGVLAPAFIVLLTLLALLRRRTLRSLWSG